MPELRVIEPGLLTTIQDAPGRPGLGRFGIPIGGALDASAARLANRLVGNDGDEPVLEITLLGPTLEWMDGAHVGLAGADLGALVLGRGARLAPGHSYRLRAGAVLAFDAVRHGVRSYLAVEGGYEIAPVLGSTATDLRSRFGGLDGRALQAGDILQFATGRHEPLRWVPDHMATDEWLSFVPISASLGWFTRSDVDRFCATTWTVVVRSDRSGIRLTGGQIDTAGTRIPSVGLPVGSVQVPPNGEPIVKLVDGPVTGGYPVIGVVPLAEHSRLAQAAPGTTLRFRRISVAAARALATSEGDEIRDVVLDDGDFAAGWAG